MTLGSPGNRGFVRAGEVRVAAPGRAAQCRPRRREQLEPSCWSRGAPLAKRRLQCLQVQAVDDVHHAVAGDEVGLDDVRVAEADGVAALLEGDAPATYGVDVVPLDQVSGGQTTADHLVA